MEPITALDLTQADPLDADIRAYFDKCTEKLGLIPNVLQAYAFDQAKLRAFMAMYNDLMLAPSGLSKAEREMIAVAVSSENKCVYCLTAHGAALRQLTGDAILAETIAQNWRVARLDARQRAMLAFAVKLTQHPQDMEEADRAQAAVAEHGAILDALRAHDGDAAEAAMRRHIEGAHRARLKQLRDLATTEGESP